LGNTIKALELACYESFRRLKSVPTKNLAAWPASISVRPTSAQRPALTGGSARVQARPPRRPQIFWINLTWPVKELIYVIRMPILIIGDKELKIPGLGKNKPLAHLSQKRITKAAREILRSEYGYENITCNCKADIASGIWMGQCRINGQDHTFRIEE